jgi:hypothetical protein
MNLHADSVVAGARAGARNLFEECLRISAGQSLLLVAEPAGAGHYDDAMAPFLAHEAEARGAKVAVLTVDPDADLAALPPAFIAALGRVEHTVFVNRIGDRVRFGGLDCPGTKTMVHAPDLHYLGAPFAGTSFALLDAVRDRLIARIEGANTSTLRCARGTNLAMRLEPGTALATAGMSEFAVRNFPVMIFPPMPAATLSGRLVLTGALVSTNTDSYAGRILPLPSPVTLEIEAGRIRNVAGEAETAARVRAQFERVGAFGSGDPWAVNSWHTGINPNTIYRGRADADWERWDCVAFGSPRYTHFHMCGADPGLICGQLFDATIAFDGEDLWRAGDFIFPQRPEIAPLVAAHADGAKLGKTSRAIGIDAAAHE